MPELIANGPIKQTNLSKRQQKIAERQRQMAKQNNTNFRKAERNFKSKAFLPDMSNVIHFSQLEKNSETNLLKIIPVQLPVNLWELDRDMFEDPNCNLSDKNNENTKEIHKPFLQKAYTLSDHPVKKTLCDWACFPNKTNLDPFYNMEIQNSLFEQHVIDSENQITNPEYKAPLIKSLFENDESSFKESKSTTTTTKKDDTCTTDNTNSGITGIKNLETGENRTKCQTNLAVTQPKNEFYLQSHNASDLLDHLRWTTIGNQYNWTTKAYDIDKNIPVHDDLSLLMKNIIKCIYGAKITNENGTEQTVNAYDFSKYVVQAGVINYYGLDSTLLAHVDKSEENMDAPLISISLGCSCIYLVGGDSKQDNLTPILLNSGDIMASCGPSRTAYHGVPRIFDNSCPSFLTDIENEELDIQQNQVNWKPFSDYISKHRINFNARQCTL
ncbi:hypothetical protein BB558_001469 [Smittium angustum]|uniref:Fe2OG dioxygenase domain-containing protein n=1 Tax=Smittium angustum TaxID=133377 RepID=A0A2U1JBP3_SMIAN|nr:hypothetical protein BB558_001469 [Smittium angustum]